MGQTLNEEEPTMIDTLLLTGTMFLVLSAALLAPVAVPVKNRR